MNLFRTLSAIWVLFLISCAHQFIESKIPPTSPSLVDQVQGVLSADIDSLLREFDSSREINLKAREIYQSFDYKPLWVSNGGISASGQELLKVIEESEVNGLDPKLYYLNLILNLLSRVTSLDLTREQNESRKVALARIDVVLTLAYLKLASDIQFGKIDPASVDSDWHLSNKKLPRLASVDVLAITSPERLRSFFNTLYPAASGHARLREALKSMKSLQQAGGWVVLPADLKLRPGDRDAVYIPLLRARLQDSHDFSNSDLEDESDLFNSDIEAGLRSFQIRHGLDPNGVLNSETVREMNVTIEDRIRQIEVNMERWRWLPQDLGKNYIMVNVADFQLSIIASHLTLNSMNVVVGQEFRRTPSFASEIVAIEINPKWVVPQKLAKEDLLPILRLNPEILVKKGFHLYLRKTGKEVNPIKIDWQLVDEDSFPYRIVQESGPLNALGKMKFWLPNEFGIFLHDTPARELFEKKIRTFSSGCIRVEKPFELAEYLLRDQAKWNKVELQKEVLSGANRTIAIKTPLPIYLLYWTAWVDENSVIHFRPDIYGRNWELDKQLRSFAH